MNALYGEYLAQLDELGTILDQLTQITKTKIEAVRNDDLLQLNECIKQEQAMALTLKNIERKRIELLEQMKLSDVPLSGLTERFPASMRRQAMEASESLRAKYDDYTSASEAARTLLEVALHQIEKLLPQDDANPDGAKIPPTMGTDIRA